MRCDSDPQSRHKTKVKRTILKPSLNAGPNHESGAFEDGLLFYNDAKVFGALQDTITYEAHRE